MERAPLYYKIIGEGEPIIILHGLFGMSDNWASFAKKLARDRMVILVDQRDHGRSAHTEDFNYDLLAEDIVGLMEDNWIHKAVVMGHSMGGKTAINLAHHHPDMVSQLIVVDIGPGENPDRHTTIFDSMQQVNLEQAVSRTEIETALIKDIHQLSTVRFLMKNLSRNKGGSGFRWKMNLPLLRKQFHEILAPIEIEQIEVPSLFVRGERSDYIDEEQENIISEHFTDYKLVSIANSGHWVHADQPDALYDVLYDFLN